MIKESDVAHVGLHLFEHNGDAVTVVISDGGVRGELHKVVRLKLDNVREQVASLQRKIFDDKVKRLVGIFDARNGNVSNLLDKRRNNNLANVIPQVSFELERSFAIKEQIPGQASPVFAESLIKLIRDVRNFTLSNTKKKRTGSSPKALNHVAMLLNKLSNWVRYFSS